MAAPMEADVDQRLSMSLDDLIASKKKAAPKGSAAGKTGAAGGKSAKSTASAKKPAAQRRKGAKGKQSATAEAGKSAAGGAGKRVPAKKRGGRGGGVAAGLGVRVQALKNAPVRLPATKVTFGGSPTTSCKYVGCELAVKMLTLRF